MSEESPPYELFAYQIQLQANGLAGMYGGPLYLVGSALYKKDPPDYDVRVILEEHDMVRLFGRWEEPSHEIGADLFNERMWRQEREQLKQSRRLARMLGCRVDFQFQTVEKAARYEGKPRVRLDRAPEGFFEAGMGDA